MASLNTVILIGNLTRNPEGKRTNSGTSVCELGLAINEKYKDEDRTVFVDITAWGKTADFCRDYLQKGASVAVMGRLQLDTWQDRDTGQNRSKLKVVADRIQSLTRPQNANQSQQQSAAPPPPAFPPQNAFPEPQQDNLEGLEPGNGPMETRW